MKKIYSIPSIGKSLLLLFAMMLLALPQAAAADATGKTITGTVTDAQTGAPVIGATISVKGSYRSTAADVDGRFSLKDVAPSNTLVVAFMGYKSKEVPVGAATEFNVTLEEDHLNLEEIVVIGYGTTKKANLTGSVASINTKTMDARPLQSVSQAIQGQVAGVVAVQSSGRPGSQTADITIRGRNSINAGGPLVIIDGVPGNMNTMDPNDVESMSILKDAASAAIYGVQAASGVILITTKKGQRNKPTSVTYNGNVSWATPTDMPKFLGSADYAMLYNEGQLNQNPKATVRYTPEDIQKYKDGSSPYTHANTDWYSETFRPWTMETQHSVNISGGTEKTVYSGSMGAVYQDGKTSNNNYSRYNARFNTETQITKWFKIGMNLSGYTSTNNMGWESPEALVQYANRLAPTYPVYNEDGSFNGKGYQNPVAEMALDGWRKYEQTEWTANGYAQINFFPTLSLKGVYSYRDYMSNDTGFRKLRKYDNQGPNDREAYNNSTRTGRETVQVLLNYDESFGKHNLGFLAGYEQYTMRYRWLKASRKKGGNDELTESLSTLDPTTQENSSGGYDVARQSAFGRLQYNFATKYFAEVNFRADASSRFAPSQRWGFFPSVSAAWRITEENFMKEATWLSNLKLRAGYGVTGNEELSGNYEWQSTYGYEKYPFDNAAYQTVQESRFANEALTWATVTNIEVGLEAAFLNNQLGFDLTVYEKTTDGMLLRLPQPAVLGAKAPQQNAGQVKNFGIDMTVFHNGRSGDFNYSISLNAGYVRNEITDLRNTDGENPDNKKQWFIKGQPIGSFYGYQANGMYRDAEDVKNSANRTAKDQPGDIKYTDLNNDGKITADDRQVIGYNFPKWTGGLSFSANWKNLDLQILFQGAVGTSAYLDGESAYAFYNDGKVMERHLDRWTPENLEASYPRMTVTDNINFDPISSFWLVNMSYLRLKNVTLGYTLPQTWMRAIKMQAIKVFFAGENLFTIKDKGAAGWDPESPSGRGAMYANVLKLSLGLRVTF